MSKKQPLLGPGEVAERLGCQSWRVGRAHKRGLFPFARTVGRVVVFEESDLPRIKEILQSVGYLKG